MQFLKPFPEKERTLHCEATEAMYEDLTTEL
jgi:hypothetical protein